MNNQKICWSLFFPPLQLPLLIFITLILSISSYRSWKCYQAMVQGCQATCQRTSTSRSWWTSWKWRWMFMGWLNCVFRCGTGTSPTMSAIVVNFCVIIMNVIWLILKVVLLWLISGKDYCQNDVFIIYTFFSYCWWWWVMSIIMMSRIKT